MVPRYRLRLAGIIDLLDRDVELGGKLGGIEVAGQDVDHDVLRNVVAAASRVIMEHFEDPTLLDALHVRVWLVEAIVSRLGLQITQAFFRERLLRPPIADDSVHVALEVPHQILLRGSPCPVLGIEDDRDRLLRDLLGVLYFAIPTEAPTGVVGETTRHEVPVMSLDFVFWYGHGGIPRISIEVGSVHFLKGTAK